MVKNPPANAGDIRDVSSDPGLGRSPGGGKGNPLQYSCLENPVDRGAYRAVVHEVADSDRTERPSTHHIGPPGRLAGEGAPQGSHRPFASSRLSLAQGMLCAQPLGRVWLFAAPWTSARPPPLSVDFFRHDHWSGLPQPSPGELPNPGSEPTFLHCRWILYPASGWVPSKHSLALLDLYFLLTFNFGLTSD